MGHKGQKGKGDRIRQRFNRGIRDEYAIKTEPLFDVDAPDYNVTTTGPLDRYDDTSGEPAPTIARELLRRNGQRRRLPDSNVPAEDSFNGRYTTRGNDSRRDRKNYAEGSDHEGTTDWRKEILEDRADADIPLDKLIGR